MTRIARVTLDLSIRLRTEFANAAAHISNDGPEKPLSGRPAIRKRALPVLMPPSTTIAAPLIRIARTTDRYRFISDFRLRARAVPKFAMLAASARAE